MDDDDVHGNHENNENNRNQQQSSPHLSPPPPQMSLEDELNKINETINDFTEILYAITIIFIFTIH